MPSPLFTFRLPPGFSGSSGTNRTRLRCSLGCTGDLGALCLFLEKYPTYSPSFGLYRCQLERILLWLLFERSKPLSSADDIDCLDNLRFLARPHGRLAGQRARRVNDAWVPFGLEPLSEAAQIRAATALRTEFEFLVAGSYLRSNPWDVGFVSMRSEQAERDVTHACLQTDVLDVFVDCVRARPRRGRAITGRRTPR